MISNNLDGGHHKLSNNIFSRRYRPLSNSAGYFKYSSLMLPVPSHLIASTYPINT